MTPKERALKFFNKMCNSVDELLPLDVKQCALVAIDEIIDILPQYEFMEDIKKSIPNRVVTHWKEVRKEIEKL